MTRKGEQYYRLSTIRDGSGRGRGTLQYDYGLSQNLSATVNLVSLPLEQDGVLMQHNYMAGGLTGYWNALLASVTMIDDSESGSALAFDLQTRFGSTTLGFKHIQLNGFESEEYQPSTQQVSHSSQIQLNTAIPQTWLPRIPVTLSYQREEYENGDELEQIMNMLSMSARGVAVTNEVTHQQLTGQQATANGNSGLAAV